MKDGSHALAGSIGVVEAVAANGPAVRIAGKRLHFFADQIGKV